MNNKNKTQYRRLFVLSPEYYQKLSQTYEKQKKINNFDKEIYDILFDENLNDTQKYYTYLKKLSNRVTELNLNNDFQENKSNNASNLSENSDNLIKSDTEVNIIKSDVDAIKTPEPIILNSKNQFTQTNVPESVFETKSNPPIEEIFEHTPQLPENVHDNKVTDMPIDMTVNENFNQSLMRDHYLEEKLHEIAQKYLEEKNMNNIVPVKQTLDADYRIFNNKLNNDQIAVEVKPVYDFLYNNKKNPKFEVHLENKELQGKYIVLTGKTKSTPANENKRKRKANNIFENVLENKRKKQANNIPENVLEKTLFDLAISNSPLTTSKRDLVVDRESIDKDFRIYEDKTTGSKIAIEVAPVYDHLMNKTDKMDVEVQKTNNYTVLRSRTIEKKLN
jgi:hypothetical protein